MTDNGVINEVFDFYYLYRHLQDLRSCNPDSGDYRVTHGLPSLVRRSEWSLRAG